MRHPHLQKKIINNYAEELSNKIIRSTILAFQKMDYGLLSGDETCLQNTWDEICVQLQVELSVYWDHVYDEMVKSFVQGHVEGLKDHEVKALWSQTEDYYDWMSDNADGNNTDYPDSTMAVTEALVGQIYSIAANWSNARIRKYKYEH